MHFLRVISRFLATSLFRSLITLLPFLLGAVWLFGNPSHLESTLRKSGVYDNFTHAVITESIKKATDTTTKNLLSDPKVQTAIEQSFTPEVLRDASEQAIDGTYKWASGQSPTIQFTIDFSKPRQNLTSQLTNYALTRAESLPSCTADQLRTMPLNQDILSIPCIPPGVNAQEAANQFAKDTLDSANFLNNSTVTSASLPKDASGRTFTARYAWLPDAYRWFKISPWIVGVVAILTGLGLVYLHDDRRRGVRVIGWALIGTAAFIIVSVLLYAIFASKFIKSTNTTDLGQLGSSFMNAISEFIREFNVYVVKVSVVYAILGTAVLFAAHRLSPKVPQSDTAVPTPPTTEATKSDTAVTSNEPPKEEDK